MLVRSEIAATKTDSEDIWIRGLRELFDFYLCNCRMVSVIVKDEAQKTMVRKTHSNFTTIIGGLKFWEKKRLQAVLVGGCALQWRPYCTLSSAERAGEVKTGLFALLCPDINFQINQSFKMHHALYYISTRNLWIQAWLQHPQNTKNPFFFLRHFIKFKLMVMNTPQSINEQMPSRPFN